MSGGSLVRRPRNLEKCSSNSVSPQAIGNNPHDAFVRQSIVENWELEDPTGDTWDYEEVIEELSKPETVYQVEEAPQVQTNSITPKREGEFREIMEVWTEGQGDICTN